MNSRTFARFTRWLNLPTGVLMALLQRSPALKLISAVGEYVVASPVGTILKGTITAAASLGAVNSLAGATTLSATSPSPLAATVGTPVSVAFTALGAASGAFSWSITGNVPAGLAFYNVATGGSSVTTGTVNTPLPLNTLYLRGTPTTAGTSTFNLRAWENANASGAGSPLFSYTVTVTGAATAAPVITANPVSQTVAPGGSATVTVAASGTGLTYQWQNNGVNVAGATGATLTLTNLQSSTGGDYTAVVTNTGGSVTSNPATLTVATPVAGRLINLSVRTVAGAGSSTLIAGFVLGGNGNKTVAVRGTGQTLGLAPFNITGVLPNPLLTLFSGSGSSLASNDSWNAAPNLAAITATGLTNLGTTQLDPKDAIIMMALPVNGPTPYTTQLTDVGGGSGVGLIEAFDTDSTAPGTPGFDSQARFANLSARAQVTTGSGVLIAGFIFNGTSPIHLMIRATGPTLANPMFGVTGVLADPKLELRRQSDGKLMAQNDDWSSAPNQAEIVAAGGDKLATVPLNAKESVLVLTLAPSPGGYTAVVSGVNNTTGIALVELYELP